MAKIAVSEFVSLDGVMEEPSWNIEWESEEKGTYKRHELFESDALLLGRVSFEGFAAAWPTMTDEDGDADRIGTLPKHVVTSKSGDLSCNGTAVDGHLTAAVAKLREAPGQDVLVFRQREAGPGADPGGPTSTRSGRWSSRSCSGAASASSRRAPPPRRASSTRRRPRPASPS